MFGDNNDDDFVDVSALDVVEVRTLIEDTINGDQVTVGLDFNSFEDPTDPNFVFLTPTIYVKNLNPTQPKHVIMLVDTSGSMRGVGIEAIHKTLPMIFEQLRPNDRVSLLTFSDKVTAHIANQSKQELANEFSNKVAALQAQTSTALNDAILSIGDLPNLVPGHTTVLLLTDGQEGASIVKTTPDQVIKMLSEKFHGNPPRIFPIGLGQEYDHEYMKRCSIAANFGMIDARDQERLSEHVGHMINGLAMGVHIGLQLGDDAEQLQLGIVGYNTINTLTPIRMLKRILQQQNGRINISIGNTTHSIACSEVQLASEQLIRDGLQAFIKAKARQIYDDFALNIAARIAEIEKLITIYQAHIDVSTQKDLTTYLEILDRKELVEKAKAIIFYPDHRAPGQLLFNNGWQSAVEEAQKSGRLNSRYPNNMAYVNDIIINVEKGHAAGSKLSVNRVPNAAVQAVDMSTANQFTSNSSVSSRPFMANLSRPPVYPNYAATTNTITLDRRVDFSKLPKNVIIESVFYSRETIRFETSSQLTLDKLAEVREQVERANNLKAKLKAITVSVQSAMPNRDLSRLGLADNISKVTVSLDKCLETETGVCRHQSLWTAFLVGKLVEEGVLPAGKVTHYRATNNNLKAHSFVVYKDESDPVVPIYYLLNPAQHLRAEIKTQADFEKFVGHYNERGLDWILRNFAKDNGFDYPAVEDQKEIGEAPILLLEIKALLMNNSNLMHLINELRRRGLILANEYRIRQTPENKMVLWHTLVEFGCIFPEEKIEGAGETDVVRLRSEADAAEQAFRLKVGAPLQLGNHGVSSVTSLSNNGGSQQLDATVLAQPPEHLRNGTKPSGTQLELKDLKPSLKLPVQSVNGAGTVVKLQENQPDIEPAPLPGLPLHARQLSHTKGFQQPQRVNPGAAAQTASPFVALAMPLANPEQLSKAELKQAKATFLTDLKTILNQNRATRLQIVEFFEILQNKEGAYKAIHTPTHSLADSIRLPFAGRKKQELNQKKFWHTKTYQAALKSMKEAYVNLENDSSLVTAAQILKGQAFINYMRTNNIIPRGETKSAHALKSPGK